MENTTGNQDAIPPYELYSMFSAATATRGSPAGLGKSCTTAHTAVVWGGALQPPNSRACREWPQPSLNRHLVNHPALADVPLTGLSLCQYLRRFGGWHEWHEVKALVVGLKGLASTRLVVWS